MVREKRLPFEVSIDPFYFKEKIERLKRSIYEIETTGETIHDIDNETS